MLGAGNGLPLAGKAKGTAGSTVFRAQHAAAPGPFPPPPRPSSNSTPGKLGFESSLRGRCERDERAGRGRAGTLVAERPKGPPPTSQHPPPRTAPGPFLPPPVVSEAPAAAPSRPGSLTTSRHPPGVAATVAAGRAGSTHSVPSLPSGQPLSGKDLSIHLCVSFTLALPLLHSSNTSLCSSLSSYPDWGGLELLADSLEVGGGAT